MLLWCKIRLLAVPRYPAVDNGPRGGAGVAGYGVNRCTRRELHGGGVGDFSRPCRRSETG
jgi:hypothetical protein